MSPTATTLTEVAQSNVVQPSRIVLAKIAQDKAHLKLSTLLQKDLVPREIQITDPVAKVGSGASDLFVGKILARPRATKTYILDGDLRKVADYNAGTEFFFNEYLVHNLREVSELLQKASAQPKQKLFLVTGQLTEAAHSFPGQKRHRRSNIAKYGADGVTIEETRSALLILDIDDAAVPEWDPLNPKCGVDWICSELGPEFGNADVLVQITGSQKLALGSYARVRLYFWLAEPWSLADQRSRIKELAIAHPALHIDPSTTHLGQAIYVAPPLIIAEQTVEALHDPVGFQMEDPIPNRWYLFERSGKLLLEKPAPIAAYVYRSAGFGELKRSALIKLREPDDALSALLDHGDEVHAKILDATYNLARHQSQSDAAQVVDVIKRGLISLTQAGGLLSHRRERVMAQDLASEIERAYLGAWTTIHGRELAVQADAPLTAQDGAAILTKTINDFFYRRRNRLAVIATMGLGKTEAVIRAAMRLGSRVDLYVPDHALARETQEKVIAMGGRAVVIRGRTASLTPESISSETSPRLCQKWQVIREYQKLTQYGPGSDQLCRRKRQGEKLLYCPHYESCPYIQQFQYVPEDTKFVIRTHDHLAYGDSFLDKLLYRQIGKPEFNVIDENPISRLISDFTVPLKQLEQQAEQEFFFLKSTVKGIVSALRSGQDVMAALLRVTVGRAELAEDDHVEWGEAEYEVESLKAEFGDRPPLYLSPLQTAEEAFAEITSGVRVNHWFPIVRELSDAISNRRCTTNRIWCDISTGRANVRVSYIAPIRRVASRAVPLLLLDGSADQCALQQVFGPLDVIQINVQRNARILQVRDASFSDTSLKAGHRRLRDILALADLLKTRNSPGVVTKKSITPLFTRLDVPALHYGQLRGQNKLSECDVLLLIGRLQPPPPAVEAQARALYPYESLSLGGGYTRAPARYRTSSTTIREIQGQQLIHPDPFANLRLQQARESELAQAIDRARSVHAREQKLIVIFTNQTVNTDLQVELKTTAELLGPKDLIYLLAENRGRLPLNWRWLCERWPALFPNEARAKDFAQRCKGWAERNTLGIVKLEQDRRPGARGRPGYAIHWVGYDRIHSAEHKMERSLNRYLFGNPNLITLAIPQEARIAGLSGLPPSILQLLKGWKYRFDINPMDQSS